MIEEKFKLEVEKIKREGTDILTLQKCANHLCLELGLPKVKVVFAKNIITNGRGARGTYQVREGGEFTNGKEKLIKIDNSWGKDVIETFVHEMYHHYQVNSPSLLSEILNKEGFNGIEKDCRSFTRRVVG